MKMGSTINKNPVWRRGAHPNWVVLYLLSVSFLLLAIHTVKSEAPNIILIIADDMEWDDAGCYGHPIVRTPNLNRLAADGILFDNAFVTSSSCSPSRASIITGKYPHNTGAEELHWPVPKNQTTFVEELRNSGYWAGAAGKWHLGESLKGHFDKVMEVDTSGFQLPSGKEGLSGEFKQTYEGDARSGCSDWVPLLNSRPKDKPFFLWLAALDPHRPYDKNAIPNPHDPGNVLISPYHPDLPSVREDYALYYDEITRLDFFVGKVMTELKTQGIEENTFILFISDNGKPFPRDKTTLYDSGIKSPWLIKWPKEIKSGLRCNSLVSAIDIAPSFLELAGVTPQRHYSGKSMLPLLKDPKNQIRDYIFAEKNWHDYEDHSRAVRDKRYKLIVNSYVDLPNTPPADAVRSPIFQSMLKLYKSGDLDQSKQQIFLNPRPGIELYDTQRDPHELVNIAGQVKTMDIQKRLSMALNNWIAETGDYVPSLRTADEFNRETGKPTPARVRPRLSKSKMQSLGLTAP